MCGMGVSHGHATLLCQQMQVCVHRSWGPRVAPVGWPSAGLCGMGACGGPREQVFLYRCEYVLVRYIFITRVYHDVHAGVSGHSDHCGSMGTPTSVSHLGLPTRRYCPPSWV